MSQTAVIAGVGPGLGASLANRFATEGCDVALIARSGGYLQTLADELPNQGEAMAAPADLADPAAVRDAFEAIRDTLGEVDVLVNNASAAAWGGLRDLELASFERPWAVNCRGSFVCAQEVIPDMLEAGSGTIIFTGATSSVRGRGGALGFTAAKFAARGMAMDMAQTFGPEGVHVAHVVIDGQIGGADEHDEATRLDPDRIAETYWHLVEQDTIDTQTFEVHLTNGRQPTEFL